MIRTQSQTARMFGRTALIAVALGVFWLTQPSQASAEEKVIPLPGAIISVDWEGQNGEIIGTIALMRSLKKVVNEAGRVLGYKFDYQFHPLLGEGCHKGLARRVDDNLYRWKLEDGRVYSFEGIDKGLGAWSCSKNGVVKQRGNLYGFPPCPRPEREELP